MLPSPSTLVVSLLLTSSVHPLETSLLKDSIRQVTFSTFNGEMMGFIPPWHPFHCVLQIRIIQLKPPLERFWAFGIGSMMLNLLLRTNYPIAATKN
jgi:hypothetical protein